MGRFKGRGNQCILVGQGAADWLLRHGLNICLVMVTFSNQRFKYNSTKIVRHHLAESSLI